MPGSRPTTTRSARSAWPRPAAVPFDPPKAKTFEVSPAERQAIFERHLGAAAAPQFFGAFTDLFSNQEANDAAAEVRARIHPQGGRRPDRRRDADPHRSPARHQAAADGRRLLRDLQPRPMSRLVDIRQSPITGISAAERCGPRTAHMNWTRWCSPPASTPSPARSWRSTFVGPRRRQPSRRMGQGRANLSRPRHRRISQSVHRHRPVKPVGAGQHADRRSSSTSTGSPIALPTCAIAHWRTIEPRETAQDDWVSHAAEVASGTLYRADQFLVSRRQHSGQAAAVRRLPRRASAPTSSAATTVAERGYEGFERRSA